MGTFGFVHLENGKDISGYKLLYLSNCVSLELVMNRPLQFVLTPGWLNVAQAYWSMIESYVGKSHLVCDDPMYERFMVQGLIILKNLIKHPGIRNFFMFTPNHCRLYPDKSTIL